MFKRFILPYLFFVYSCGSLAGIKKISPLDDNLLLAKASELGIKSNLIFKIDTGKVKRFYSSIKQTNPTAYKDVFQPLQVRSFNKTGTNELYLVNCYVGGLPLKWNRNNTFDSFPLRQGQFLKPTIGGSLNEVLDYILPVRQASFTADELKHNDEIIFVYWAAFMGKNSEELIKYINGYQNKFSDKKIKIIWINVDNLYLDKS